nr:MAG TPA: hypothetical protein [Caudoviricetes sp.]
MNYHGVPYRLFWYTQSTRRNRLCIYLTVN